MYGGDWSWRIVAPVFDINKNLVAFVGRAIGDIKPKYKISDAADIVGDPKKLLYGIHRARKNSVIIVEGITDVWRIGDNCVALLGIDWTTEQANILRAYRDRYILFDPEVKAQRQAQRLGNWLSLFPGNTEIISGLSSDPADLSKEQAQKIKKRLFE
jgi:DNA primase